MQVAVSEMKKHMDVLHFCMQSIPGACLGQVPPYTVSTFLQLVSTHATFVAMHVRL